MALIQMEANRLERYRDARLEVDYGRQTVSLDQAPVYLTRLEFELLAMLTRCAGEIVPKGTLELNIWGYGPEVHSRTLNVHLRRLRVKLGEFGRQHIETVFGLGYRLQPSHAPAGLTRVAGA